MQRSVSSFFLFPFFKHLILGVFSGYFLELYEKYKFPIDFCQQYFSWVVLLFFRFGEEESPTFKLADRYNMKFPDFT